MQISFAAPSKSAPAPGGGRSRRRRAYAAPPPGRPAQRRRAEPRRSGSAGSRGKTAQVLEVLAPAGLSRPRASFWRPGQGQASMPRRPRICAAIVDGRLNGAAKPPSPSRSTRRRARSCKPGDAGGASGASARGSSSYRFDNYRTENSTSTSQAAERPSPSRRRPAAARRKRGRALDGGGRRHVLRARSGQRAAERSVIRTNSRARAQGALTKLGVKVEVLGEAEMKKLGMGALLGVGQGSERESQLVVMQWNGARKKKETAGRLRRQGRVLRFRRPVAQDRRRHDGHEGRHGRRGRRHRHDAGAGGAQGARQCGGRDRPGREHAGRQRAAPRRCGEIDVGPDHRGAEHRRGRPARAGRRAHLHPAQLQAEIRDRSRDADRRDHGGAGLRACRPVLQRRQARRTHHATPARPRASRCGGCRWATPTTR